MNLVQRAVKKLEEQQFRRITNIDVEENAELTVFCIPFGHEEKIKNIYGLKSYCPIVSQIPSVTRFRKQSDSFMSVHKKQGHCPIHYHLEEGLWKPFGCGDVAARAYFINPQYTFISIDEDITTRVLQKLY